MRLRLSSLAWAVALWAVWMLLQTRPGVGSALLGAALALMLALWLVQTRARRRLRGRVLAHLLLRVVADVVVSNLVVARAVLFRSRQLRPGFVEVPLRIEDRGLVVMLASIVSLTPGTLSVDYDPDSGRLLVHALDAPEPAAVADAIRSRYEGLLMELFE